MFGRRITVALSLALLSPAASTGRVQQVEYRDPQSRFAFSYPQDFGETSVGTDNGFGNRVAAIRFSVFSKAAAGGEAVVGKGSPSIDLQAAGGLYDDIANGTLPAPVAKAVASVLPRLTAANFCDQIAREQHVDPASPAFASLPDNQRQGIGMMDRLGNVAPKVYRCNASGDIVTFDKDAAMSPGGARRRVYGTVRFLTGRYSMFAIVRAVGMPSDNLLDQIEQSVRSFRVLP